MVETIRGIVDIEEAKRDKSLERTIQVVGVGLGSGSIATASFSAHIDKPFTFNSKHQVHPIASSLLLSALVTVVAGRLAWLWSKHKEKSNKITS